MFAPGILQNVIQVFDNQFDHVEDNANKNKEHTLEKIAIAENRTPLLNGFLRKEHSSGD